MSEIHDFIAAQYAHDQANNTPNAPTIADMCAWMDVSTSWYYQAQGRPPTATAQRRERLKPKVVEIFSDSDGTYGHRRVHDELLRAGEDVGVELVRDLMRELNLVACQPRPYRATTIPDAAAPAIPDLVARDFTAHAPGVKLVGDIT